VPSADRLLVGSPRASFIAAVPAQAAEVCHRAGRPVGVAGLNGPQQGRLGTGQIGAFQHHAQCRERLRSKARVAKRHRFV
jgi:hypothetical protein